MSVDKTESLAPDRDVKVVWFPSFEQEDYRSEDYTVAEIIASCDSLYMQLDRIRSRAGITELIPFPAKLTRANLHAILRRIEQQQYGRGLGIWAEWLAHSYRLSKNWNLSFEIAIACHVLPVPPDPTISVYVPSTTDRFGILGKIRDIEMRQPGTAEILRHPLISFNYQVSINELKQYIENNRAQIRQALEALPAKPSSGKAAHVKLMRGQLAWLLKNHRKDMKSWPEVATFLTDNLLPEGKVIDEVEARKLAEAFIRQQKQIDV